MNGKKTGESQGGFCPVAEVWEEHRREAKIAMERVGVIYEVIRGIHGDTKHLAQLPIIAQEIQTLRTTSFDAAIKREPLLARALMFTVMTLGIVVILTVVYFTQVHFNASLTGIETFTGDRPHDTKKNSSE